MIQKNIKSLKTIILSLFLINVWSPQVISMTRQSFRKKHAQELADRSEVQRLIGVMREPRYENIEAVVIPPKYNKQHGTYFAAASAAMIGAGVFCLNAASEFNETQGMCPLTRDQAVHDGPFTHDLGGALSCCGSLCLLCGGIASMVGCDMLCHDNACYQECCHGTCGGACAECGCAECGACIDDCSRICCPWQRYHH